MTVFGNRLWLKLWTNLRFLNNSMRNFSNFNFVLEWFVTLINTMWLSYWPTRSGIKTASSLGAGGVEINNVTNSCGCKWYSMQSYDNLSTVTQWSTVPHAHLPRCFEKRNHWIKFQHTTFVHVGTLREKKFKFKEIYFFVDISLKRTKHV